MKSATTEESKMSATATINGTTVSAPEGAIAYKYADPVEDARWIFDDDDLCRIRSEDPNLIVAVSASDTALG